MPATHLRPMNHVAVSVPDIQAVVDWYTAQFGFELIGPIHHIKRSESPNGAVFGIYGASLNEVKIAYMATGNGTGFEVFEFVDPPAKKPSIESMDGFDYARAGFFHICVTDPKPEELAERVVKAGGSKIGDTVGFPQLAGHQCLYLKDPWGNVVEVLSVSFERLAQSSS